MQRKLIHFSVGKFTRPINLIRLLSSVHSLLWAPRTSHGYILGAHMKTLLNYVMAYFSKKECVSKIPKQLKLGAVFSSRLLFKIRILKNQMLMYRLVATVQLLH